MEANELILGRNLLLNRLPILNLKSIVSAYRLEVVQVEADSSLHASSLNPSVTETFESLDPYILLGDQKAIVAVDPDVINSPSFGGKWRDRLILQVSASALSMKTEPDNSRTGSHEIPLCYTDLSGDGVSLQNLPPPSCAMVDVRSGQTAIDQALRLLNRSATSVIATSVNTRQDFEMCSQRGIELFQGDFYTTPTAVGSKVVSPNQALLLELSTQTSRNEDIRSIEAIFKKNPDLTFGLMNLVQSAFYAVPKHVASIRQAVAMLGYDNLHKWASLMLFTVEQSNITSKTLFEAALTRARTMELAASNLRNKGLGSSAYIVGVFSLIPTLFDVPLAEILEKANFVDEIKSALLERSGILGAMLSTLESLERGDYEAATPSSDCGFMAADILRARSAVIVEQGQLRPVAVRPTVANSQAIDAQVRVTTNKPEFSSKAGTSTYRNQSWLVKLLLFLGLKPRRRSPA
jgi:c-di-GMP phosphodiesterase